jgi:hypothetical protein
VCAFGATVLSGVFLVSLMTQVVVLQSVTVVVGLLLIFGAIVGLCLFCNARRKRGDQYAKDEDPGGSNAAAAPSPPLPIPRATRRSSAPPAPPAEIGGTRARSSSMPQTRSDTITSTVGRRAAPEKATRGFPAVDAVSKDAEVYDVVVVSSQGNNVLRPASFVRLMHAR